MNATTKSPHEYDHWSITDRGEIEFTCTEWDGSWVGDITDWEYCPYCGVELDDVPEIPLKKRILTALYPDEIMSHEELEEHLGISDPESRRELEQALNELQAAGRIVYSGKAGGYLSNDKQQE